MSETEFLPDFNTLLEELPEDVIIKDNFSIFSKMFHRYFSDENECSYKNGNFILKYKIEKREYKIKFNMSYIKTSDKLKLMFHKLFKFDIEKKKGNKPDVLCYNFQFVIFRDILCKFLYKKYLNSDLVLEDLLTDSNLNLDLFNLLEDREYYAILMDI